MGKTYKRNDRHLNKDGRTFTKPQKKTSGKQDSQENKQRWKFSAREEAQILDDMRL